MSKVETIKGKSHICKYFASEFDFTQTWWCNLQHDDLSKVHVECDCKNCPDFMPIEWEESYITNDQPGYVK